ncbi:PepSY-like domain-containing protein [Candidatus Nitrotoga sp. M5]|uniref:PepSY-like domain-containing protein n=1 Tax=Candidatus Nitrotoga sp. M5 TaxID=2890409 RepID=UPI001EF41038|nr:PepSY-like domain-containing protein [Candidatus Nitrotoga sp. M5]CAH1388034.1 Beta-lactamase-inhibitor-like, PepSY-like [Candidatus Nitrotoga sp. M5]
MKTIAIVLSLLLVTLISCDMEKQDDPNDVTLTPTEIPAAITTYVTAHFSPNTINKAVKEIEDGVVSYEIYLSENIELEFNSTYEITNIDSHSKLPDSAIPQAILDYVTKNYPNNYITDWELELNHQQVELNNNVELEFALNGDFMRVDKD